MPTLCNPISNPIAPLKKLKALKSVSFKPFICDFLSCIIDNYSMQKYYKNMDFPNTQSYIFAIRTSKHSPKIAKEYDSSNPKKKAREYNTV
jgi:hypothetical protein